MRTSKPELDPITMDEFKVAVKDILLRKVDKKPKWENEMPGKEELNRKWKLVRKKD